MPEVNNKKPEVLICARPDETVDFEFKGAVFEIGILPRRVYLKYMALMNRASEGLDVKRLPDEKNKEFERRVSIEAGKKIMSPEFLDDFIEIQDEVVMNGVKGHRKLCYPDKAPIPFNTKPSIEAGRECQIVDDYTMRVYDTVKAVPDICDFAIERARGGDDPKAKRQRKK